MLQEHSISNIRAAVNDVIRELVILVGAKTERRVLFSILSTKLRIFFHYDRFCINLYDGERDFLNLFSMADGISVDCLAHTRAIKNTVAGMAISSRKPVVINDLSAQHIAEDGLLPLANAGLKATIAVPMLLNDGVIGTLHVSFVRKPDNMMEILAFLSEMAPWLAVVLFAVLAEEHSESTHYQDVDSFDNAGLPPLENRLLETPDMAGVMSVANNAAKLQVPVLIVGETGTGKSMLARWLHQHSLRKEAPFIKVNCPSLSSNLFESEMFGYAKGAFTGAYTSRIGRVEAAHNGTLFLDEIGELAPDMQSKLLQVMEESCFERVGETRARHVDIRIITATNIDTRRAMETGTLRRDLFYRIASVILRMPPLRERRNDILMLANYFIRQFSLHWKLQTPKLSQNILSILSAYDWPGNIRQLRNIVSRLLLRSLDGPVDEKFINKLLWEENRPTTEDGIASKEEKICGVEKSFPSLEEYERTHILEALRRTGGRLSGPSGAATLLGIPRSTLQHRMRKLGIHS